MASSSRYRAKNESGDGVRDVAWVPAHVEATPPRADHVEQQLRDVLRHDVGPKGPVSDTAPQDLPELSMKGFEDLEDFPFSPR